MDLHRLVGAEHGRLAGEKLGDGGLGGEALTRLFGGLLGQGGLVNQQAAGLDAAFHIGDLPLDALEATDGAAKGLALAGVAQAGLVGRLGDAQRLRGDADAPRIQHGHGDLEPLSLFAQPVLHGTFVILEVDFAGGAGPDT